jgi:hypothetical protein
MEETIKSCFEAGLRFGRVISSPEPVFTDYLPEGEIPYSELALHTRTAGSKIKAVACTLTEDEKPRWCTVAFVKDGKCGIVEGLPGEVLPIEYRKKKFGEA